MFSVSTPFGRWIWVAHGRVVCMDWTGMLWVGGVGFCLFRRHKVRKSLKLCSGGSCETGSERHGAGGIL